MTDQNHLAAENGWRKNLARLQAIGIDAVLIAMALLMAELLVFAFSGRRGPTGLLLTAEEILDLLHYGLAAAAGLFLAVVWHLFHRSLGAPPGWALVVGVPERERDLDWTHTLRGWFAAVFIELTFFAGWLITELDLVDFLTKFGKARDIVFGLANPSITVLHEGLVAVQSQAYGPEARGGATRSDIIIADEPIKFPKVIQPNVLVCLTQEAYNKFSGLIRPGGLLISDKKFVQITQRVDARQIELPLYQTVVEEIDDPGDRAEQAVNRALQERRGRHHRHHAPHRRRSEDQVRERTPGGVEDARERRQKGDHQGEEEL